MRKTLTMINFNKGKFDRQKAFMLRDYLYESIIYMLKTNNTFKYLSPKYRDVYRFFTYFKECTYLKINNVHYSRQIKKRFSKDSRYRHFAHFIGKRLEKGKGIEDYLSSDAHKLHPDMMYLDFLLIHLHFDNYALLTGFQKKFRSHMLLILRIRGRDAYMVDIIPDDTKEFLSQKYLQIMYDNWPDTLITLNNLKISTKASFSDVGLYRKYGVNQAYSIKDKDDNDITILSPGVYNAARSVDVFNSIDKIPEFLFNIIHLNSRFFKRNVFPGYFKLDVKNKLFKYYRKSDNKFILSFSSRYFLNIVLRTSNIKSSINMYVNINS